ncbi:hypothetical protein Cni_G25509 [Canna indica]|uniref:prephenate dehydratase n=1 Tax=Canna indica TaxID=4628 RepID=A0AAQ3L1Z6_9LILI|nr:hypothetical protein Cni_G25509 [Canna indica]
MALRLHSFVESSASADVINKSQSRRSFVGRVTVRASADFKHGNRYKREQETRQEKRRKPSLEMMEEFASQLDREFAVANLERLFRQQAAGGDRPPGPGGSSGGPVRVAYQGSRGSYCQEAAAKAFPASSAACEVFACDHMEDAFAVLEDRSAHRAIVPAENSLDGPIDRNLDLLLRYPGVRIVGELVLPVNHCLLSLPDASRSRLRRVISHPQALSHCRQSLEALDLEVEEACSATEAAQFVAENRVADTAVIGSQMAAREFGLRVIEHNFQDEHLGGNYNRFLQLGLSDSVGEGRRMAYKTTVAFTLEGGPSDLFRAMWIFESRGVRVTRVDHRPNREKPLRVVNKGGERGNVTYLHYVFVLDVEGSASDATVKAALTALADIAAFTRVLGSYACTCHAC